MERQLRLRHEEKDPPLIHGGRSIPFRNLNAEDLSKKTRTINEVLVDLSIRALGPSDLDTKARILDQIYSSGYRHGYAGILDIISDIDKKHSEASSIEDDAQEIDKLSILTTNLDNLKEHVRTDERTYNDNTFYGIVKLSDHVKLEIHRLRDIQEQDRQKQQMTGTIQNLLTRSEELTAEIEVAQKNSEKIQMHMVAILGIFAAIVMAFSGGMNILSGAISVPGDSNIYNVVFTVLLCGIILFNIFAFLMASILSIVQSDNREIGNQKDGILVGIANPKLVICFNAVMVILLAIDAIAMMCA